jgi:glycosyltransferase involved in cell wall biosynthesis
MTPPPHVLAVVKGLDIGGAERMIAEGARHWDRATFRYTVAYALPQRHALVGSLEALGVDVRCVGRSGRLGPGVAGRLRRLIVDAGVDLVHAHLPAMGIIARMVSPVPVVYTEHGIVSSYRAPTRLANRLTYRRNAAVIAVSRAVADSTAGYGGPAPIVIPNGVGVDLAPYAAARARAELGLGAHDPLVVHVGNIRPEKGHEILIGAAAILSRHRPDLRMVSIGLEVVPGDLERLRALARRAGAGATIRFLGSRADALDFVAAADVYAHPSTDESFGLAVLEAMALERPVVAAAVGGVPGIVDDGETGILVPPGDPGALAAGIERLLDDPETARRLGRAAHRVATHEHSIEAMVRSIEAVYRQVLSG